MITDPSNSPRAIASLPGIAIAGGLCTIVVILGFWLALHWVVRSEISAQIDSAARHNAGLARVLEEHTLSVLRPTDEALRRLQSAVAAGEPIDARRIAGETGLVPNALVQFGMIDASGHVAISNLESASSLASKRVHVGDREHFRVHRERADIGLFISAPVLGRVSKRATIQLTRRINHANGEFAGVATASLDVGYLEQLYRQVDLGTGGYIGLIGAEGTVRAAAGTAPWTRAPLERLGADDGATATVTNERRIEALHRIDSYPLLIVVSSATESALANMTEKRRHYGQLAAGLTLMLLLASALAWTALMRLHRTAEALRVREAEARVADARKSEFLASVSHELRNPLTSIRGFAELLEHRVLDSRHRDQAATIRRAAEHLTALLNEILDLSKIEAGALDLAPESVDPIRLVDEVRALFEGAASAKGLALSCRFAGDLPSMVRWDPLRVKQILNNLLSNAIKFTASGKITISVVPRGEFLSLQVRDTGPGIPRHLQTRVFEKFVQAGHHPGGTGLGLALAQSLAKRMGGWIELESSEGEGSTFRLELPRSVDNAPQAEAGPAAPLLANASIE